MRIICLLVCVLWVAAAESRPIAKWQGGDGTVTELVMAHGHMVAAHQPIRVAASGPARMVLLHSPGGNLVLGAGTIVSLREDKSELHIDLTQGVLQLDIPNKGHYSRILVHGSVSTAELVGTMICMERTAGKGDFVAVVRGKIKTRLRKDIATTLNTLNDEEQELTARQGIFASVEDGLGDVLTLPSRPDLSRSLNRRPPLSWQSQHEGSGTQWNDDKAAKQVIGEEALRLEQANTAVASEPDPTVITEVVGPELIAAPIAEVNVSDELTQEVSVEVVSELIEQVSEGVQEDVSNDIADSSALLEEVTESVTIEAVREPLSGFPDAPTND